MSPLLPLHLAGTLAAFATFALWPPHSGPMLLVPLDGAPATALAPALAAEARLVGRGPLPGSIVVVGNRAAIGARAGHRLVVLAAPAVGCGPIAARAVA